MATAPLFHVDAFTATPFTGNPAAVCLLPGSAPVWWMQQLAAEMNLSETAYVTPANDGFVLRWFTPKVEVDLCGHATLASAHVLWETGRLPFDQQARFHTRSGLLTATLDESWVTLDFPALPPVLTEPPMGMLEALGVRARFVGRGGHILLVEVATEEEVREAAPEMAALAQAADFGVTLTARAEAPPYDFVSRFFGPAVGVPEDPVTGSAHCLLGPFWAERLGKRELMAYQASARGGELRVRVGDDRVQIAGQAATVVRGDVQLFADEGHYTQ